jgi:hypothetical protein
MKSAAVRLAQPWLLTPPPACTHMHNLSGPPKLHSGLIDHCASLLSNAQGLLAIPKRTLYPILQLLQQAAVQQDSIPNPVTLHLRLLQLQLICCYYHSSLIPAPLLQEQRLSQLEAATAGPQRATQQLVLLPLLLCCCCCCCCGIRLTTALSAPMAHS